MSQALPSPRLSSAAVLGVLLMPCLAMPTVALAKDAAGRPQAGDPHYDLEELYAAGDYDTVLATARQRLAADPQDVLVHVHLARAIFEVAEVFERTDTSIDKKTMYQEMIDVTDRGLELDPDNAHLKFARGIARGRLGTTRGVLSSLFMAKDIERDWVATWESGYRYESLDRHEMLPCDAALTLGIFYRLVPDWWIVQAIAGTRGDLDKSVSYLEQADSCSPDRVQVVKELGVSRICKGQKDELPDLVQTGLADLQRGLGVPTTTRSGQTDKKHMAMLIADPTLACEYSRDGQAELDRNKLPPAVAED